MIRSQSSKRFLSWKGLRFFTKDRAEDNCFSVIWGQRAPVPHSSTSLSDADDDDDDMLQEEEV
jgi:hypothetical protein